MIALPPRGALLALVAALALALAWTGGRRSADAPAGDGVDGAGIPRSPDGPAAGEADAGTGPGPLERLAAERDAALATVERLEVRLGEARRLAAADADELALYRRIESGLAPDGLSIGAVELVGAGTGGAALAVTLVQSRGRHRVTGSVRARVAGEGPGAGTALGDGASAFDLRFFQRVRVPLGPAAAEALAEGPEPARVEIDVRPAGDRHAPFVEIRALGPTLTVESGQ